MSFSLCGLPLLIIPKKSTKIITSYNMSIWNSSSVLQQHFQMTQQAQFDVHDNIYGCKA